MTGLARSLGLTLAVLYGLGVTIGAGIYVLVGLAAGRAGIHAPQAFLMAALVMGFSAATFAKLGTRMPVSASEAGYVEAAFRRTLYLAASAKRREFRSETAIRAATRDAATLVLDMLGALAHPLWMRTA